MADTSQLPLHRFRNNQKAVPLGNRVWQKSQDNGLIDLKVSLGDDNYLVTQDGHKFLNFCSCSYLGLNRHPRLLEAAARAFSEEKITRLSLSTLRMQLAVHHECDQDLSDLFGSRVLTMPSCSVITAGVLPLISSGHITGGKPVTTIFDAHCHFSMALIKPICGDEAPVLTCPHNDLNYIEGVCKKNENVAYIADGVYSMGGNTRLKDLLRLQDKYGLFLYLDDSHSLSLSGNKGEGFVRSSLGELSPLTMITASLGKGFGAMGGALMLGSLEHEDLIKRFGGPMAWSQNLSVGGVYAVRASAAVHRSQELGELQEKLQENIRLFDSLVDTERRGNGFPVRMIITGEEDDAVAVSRALFERGFYASAVFFPIVSRGKAGVRVMMRADMKKDDIVRFCDALKHIMGDKFRTPASSEQPGEL